MAKTYVAIASATGTGSSGTVTFSSIPIDYTDLVITVGGTMSPVALLMQVGNTSLDSGSNYGTRSFHAYTSSASSLGFANQTRFNLCPASTPSTTVPSSLVVTIANYSNSNTHKPILSATGNSGDATERLVGTWRSLLPINIVSVYLNGGNFSSGTTVNLYGVLAA